MMGRLDEKVGFFHRRKLEEYHRLSFFTENDLMILFHDYDHKNFRDEEQKEQWIYNQRRLVKKKLQKIIATFHIILDAFNDSKP